jgi:Rieske 2Fe-2S family protein
MIVRGQDSKVRAFFNVCRHRGSRLLDVTAGSGLTRILCPYHAWTYELTGELQQAPKMPASFVRCDHGLVPVRLGERYGLLFVNFAEQAPSLERWLADMPNLEKYRMLDLVPVRQVQYTVHANWKLICENYSECYHCPGAHPQLHKLTELIQRSERPMEIGACFNGGPMRLRNGVATMSNSGERRLPLIPGLTAEDARYVNYYVVYPNLLLSPHPDYVLLHYLLPTAPDCTLVHCEWLMTPAALAEPDASRDDVIDFWDLTNRQDWQLCERAQQGVVSRGYRQGPYQTSEDCVHMFDRWYADRMAAYR